MKITMEIRKLIEKADKAIEVAKELFENEHPSDTVSKTYYAMFYAAQALLKSEGIEVIKHSAVESSLGYYFAKTGRLDPKYHRMLINARKIREIADYDIQEEIVEPEAGLKLEDRNDSSGGTVTLKVIWYPKDYFTARERPIKYQEFREKLGI